MRERFMAKTPMRDLIVVLPGITGSVLEDETGREIWNASGAAVWSYIRSRGKSLDKLIVSRDRSGNTTGGSIRATRLVQGVHGVFGLGRIDGYRSLTDILDETFNLVRAENPSAPTNYIEFPYDWRLSSSVSAKALKKLVDERLPIWRESFDGDSEAKVIFIAHSMGGLVARYYIEKLEGWTNCRALFTFGTPFRGAVDAIDYLANGYKKAFLDFTNVMRSMPSVYELLPIWRAVNTGTEFKRIAELECLPSTIEPNRAREALQFHRDIQNAQETNETIPEYKADRYLIFPVAGIAQPTLQSVTLKNKTLVAARAQPSWIDASLEGGDGTVPRVSATPIELSKSYRETFFAERHGSLQNNSYCLDDLMERLKQIQSEGLEDIQGSWTKSDLESRGKISLDLDPLYLRDEPVRLRARLLDGAEHNSLRAYIARVGASSPAREFAFTESSDGLELTLEGLEAGTYRVRVESILAAANAPIDVSDVFDVADTMQE
jgi:pimeloyl-ACP methyl ester carboxylesterase